MQIKLKNVRLSFPTIFKAEAYQPGQDPKYSATFILDEATDKNSVAELKNAINKLIELEFGGNSKALASVGLRSGEEKVNDDGSYKDGFGPGTQFISASNKSRPQVVDRNPSIPLTAEDGKIYAGCRVNALVRVNAMNGKSWKPDPSFGKKIIFSLLAVQFDGNGEAFGEARVDVESAFDNLDAESQDLLG